MSVEAISWALDQQEVTTPAARFVLVTLANYAGHDGSGAFPSVMRIARQTGLSARAVQYHLRSLVAIGILRRGNPLVAAAKIRRSDRRPVVYDLVMTSRGSGSVPPDGVQGLHPATTVRGANAEGTGCKKTPNGVHPLHPIRHREPSRIRHSARISDDELGRIRAAYPKRDGSQPWSRARQAIEARLSAGDTLDGMAAGLAAYAAFCDRAGKVGTEFVMQAANFFGPDRHFAADWSPPPSKKELSEHSALEQQRARRAVLGLHDFREPEPGEQAKTYGEAINHAADAKRHQSARDQHYPPASPRP